MDNAVTIIVGAGAVLDFDHRGIIPTVNNITEEVLELPVQKVDGGERQLIKELYGFMAGRLKLVGNPEVRRYFHPKITFEELLHVLEMCLSYSSCWHDEYLHWESFPLFGTLTEPKPFLKSIDTIEYERAAYILEEKVMEIVNQYDSSFKNNAATESWYRRFWSSLRGRNIFTLNYDSTIEESLVSYEDGFEKHGDEEYCRFSARKFRPEDKELDEDLNASSDFLGIHRKFEATFPNIEMNTVPHLKLVQFIESAIRESEPDIIITHHPADTNNDHLQTSLACQEAIRLFQRRPEVKPISEFWYMEVPSCTEWALNSGLNRFQPNLWVEVGKEGVDAKIKALSMYRGVMRPYPHPRSTEALEGFAAYRGCQAGCNYAEAFEVILRRQ